MAKQKKESKVELKLLGDQPWLEDEKDWLGYDSFIEKLAALIVRSAKSAPLTIGIEGQWGTGGHRKASLTKTNSFSFLP